MARSNGASGDPKSPPAITSLSVSGFKSIVNEQTLEIRPLTLLAGANSSGKSSMLQPLLLLKQTLEAQYDPGPLLLNGPNVKFTSVSQIWPSSSGRQERGEFATSVGVSDGAKIAFAFLWKKKFKKLVLAYNIFSLNDITFKLSETTKPEEAISFLRAIAPAQYSESIAHNFEIYDAIVERMGFFLEMVLTTKGKDRSSTPGISQYQPCYPTRTRSSVGSDTLFWK